MIEDEEKEDDENLIKESTIIVHIAGAVKNNGIVEVKENARLNDVIEAAGGMNEDADLENVNLAYKVEDGQKIYIPKIKEKEEAEDNEMLEVQEENIIQEGAGSIVIEAFNKANNSEKININKANIEELKSIPGIRRGNSFKNNIV